MAQTKVKGILSYPHLFVPRSVNQGDDPKYSTSVLLRKGDPQIAAVQQIIETEKANGFPSGFPHNGKTFLKDCAVEFPQYPEIAGYMVITCNTGADSKPSVVDANLTPVIDPSLVYAGAVAWVAFNTYTYNKPVNKGVAAGLNAVMVTGEMGELGRLDNRPSVDSMFADVVGGAAPTPAMMARPAAPAPAPSAPPPAAPQYQMTAKANGFTRDQYREQGWTDVQLIEQGMMVAPVKTSFQ